VLTIVDKRSCSKARDECSPKTATKKRAGDFDLFLGQIEDARKREAISSNSRAGVREVRHTKSSVSGRQLVRARSSRT
jgi:hypothetical protein